MYPIFDWISYNTIDTKYTTVLGGNLLISPIWFLEKNATHTFLLKLGVHYGKLYLNWAIKYSWWWYSKAMTTSQLRKCRGPHENMLDVSCSSCDPTRLRVTEAWSFEIHNWGRLTSIDTVLFYNIDMSWTYPPEEPYLFPWTISISLDSHFCVWRVD